MRRGFTLIELMIVISVMAILIGISLPYFKGMQDEGNSAKCAGEMRTLTTAIESFNIHSSTGYPSQLATEQPLLWQTAITTAKPTIVKITLMDPFVPAQQYSYLTSDVSDSKYYVVFSVGPNKTTDITAITSTGALTKTSSGPTDPLDDDIYISNGPDGNSF